MRVSEEVLAVLGGLTYQADNSVVIEGQLDRKLFVKVDEVLQACGGKWNRKARAYLFGCDPVPLVSAVIAMGKVTTASDLGFFPTPARLAEQLVKLADVRPAHQVLEPSAGDGAIVDHILAAGAEVYAVEFDAQLYTLLKRSCTHVPEWAFGVALCPEPIDFMTYEAPDPFDRVVMNPPFARVGLGDHIDHVRHAFKMLIKGGVLVSIMPSSIEFRTDRRHEAFRAEVLACGTITKLPEGSFKSSGTGVNTCIVRMVRA